MFTLLDFSLYDIYDLKAIIVMKTIYHIYDLIDHHVEADRHRIVRSECGEDGFVIFNHQVLSQIPFVLSPGLVVLSGCTHWRKDIIMEERRESV